MVKNNPNLSLYDLFMALRKNFILIFSVTVLSALVCFTYEKLSPPRYGYLGLLKIAQYTRRGSQEPILLAPSDEIRDYLVFRFGKRAQAGNEEKGFLKQSSILFDAKNIINLETESTDLESAKSLLNAMLAAVREKYSSRLDIVLDSYRTRLKYIEAQLAGSKTLLEQLGKMIPTTKDMNPFMFIQYEKYTVTQEERSLVFEQEELTSLLSPMKSFDFDYMHMQPVSRKPLPPSPLAIAGVGAFFGFFGALALILFLESAKYRLKK